MRSTSSLAVAGLAAFVLLLAPCAFAQGYPKVPPDLQAAADARKAAAQKRSDEIFARAQPELEVWAAKGKPYLPVAAQPGDLPQAAIPAFPGAWGGGMYSFGGRGGRVLVVTNLDDSGPGSFRVACETPGPRIIVFNVAGIIRLQDHLRIRAPYLTIAGSTAPGDGVCIAGNTVELDTHDIVVRHLRFRRGGTDPADRDDSLGGNPVGNVIIDHVSASWSLDENLSGYRNRYRPSDGDKILTLPTVNITIQHSISSESLSTFHHAFGSTIGGLNSTFHHNLWACNTGRNPSVGMFGVFTFANNVLYNWRHRTVDGGDHRSRFNIINNCFKPGPGTPDGEIRHRLLKPESERSRTVVDHFGQAYVDGNLVVGDDRVTRDNWDGGVQPSSRAPRASVLPKIRVLEPFPHAALPLQPADLAYRTVLANAGATLPRRDAVDERIIHQVRTGTVTPTQVAPSSLEKARFYGYAPRWVDELAGLVAGGFVTDPAEVGGYPEYRGQPYLDTDADGLPDAWETTHGLNPKDATDATADLNGDGYTNIEDFINGLDPRAPKTDWTDLKNNVDPRNAAVN